MTESPETTGGTIDSTAATDQVGPRNTRLYQVLAWVGIVAGVLLIVAAVFFSGFFAGRTVDGYGWHRGYQSGQMRPDGSMGGCPMVQMQPGGMGLGGMPGGMGPGGMGPGGVKGSTPTSTVPMPPTAGQR